MKKIEADVVINGLRGEKRKKMVGLRPGIGGYNSHTTSIPPPKTFETYGPVLFIIRGLGGLGPFLSNCELMDNNNNNKCCALL